MFIVIRPEPRGVAISSTKARFEMVVIHGTDDEKSRLVIEQVPQPTALQLLT